MQTADIAGRDVGTAEECTGPQRAERRKGIVFEDAIPVSLQIALKKSIAYLDRASNPESQLV